MLSQETRDAARAIASLGSVCLAAAIFFNGFPRHPMEPLVIILPVVLGMFAVIIYPR
mgnify:CR=1 FL=1